MAINSIVPVRLRMEPGILLGVVELVPTYFARSRSMRNPCGVSGAET